MDTSKIIRGVVNSGRYTVTAPIVKEDYGLYLQIEGVELPSTYEVDFSNSEHSGTSVTMIGNADGVLIPHQFIDTGKDVFAFLYHVGADFGRTIYKFRIPNKVRPDRTNEEPTPEEQSVIDQAISALNEAVAQTAQDVIDADASAQSAQGYAEQAETAKSDAQTYANNASASATSASQSATASANSATASAQSASEAETARQATTSLVAEAQGYANASEQSAQASATSASQAQGFANSASASAQSASGYATQADISANTASTKAQDASGYAQTATQKATESAQSASQASQSAQTALQAKTDAQTAQGLAESARDTAVQAKDDAESARDTAQTLVDGISGKVEQIDSNTERIESLEDDRYKPYVTDSASGSIASFSDGADNLPLKSLVVNIDPVQDLSSGDPSPENICPISGWDGVNVRRCNENLWDDELYTLGDELELITDPTDDFYGYYNGSINDWTNLISPYTRKLFPNGVDSLTVTADYGNLHASSRYTFRVYFRYTDGTSGYNSNIMIDPRGKSRVSRTSTSGKKCVGFALYTTSSSSNKNGCIKDVRVSINGETEILVPVTAVIPISLGQTVYGGKLDVLTGKLTVYPYYASYNGEALTGEWISDRDVYAVGTTPTIGAQVVNIGAEGTEYQIEPHEIASLLGANNIFADTGDTACEYRADTKLYINRLTEPDADMIADSNITSGQYFMVGNTLYKATANIANGSAIVVGTNCTRVSLAQALNEINS